MEARHLLSSKHQDQNNEQRTAKPETSVTIIFHIVQSAAIKWVGLVQQNQTRTSKSKDIITQNKHNN